MNRFCAKCGEAVKENACFCSACGTPVENTVQGVAPSAPKKSNALMWVILSVGFVIAAVAATLVFMSFGDKGDKTGKKTQVQEDSVVFAEESEGAPPVSAVEDVTGAEYTKGSITDGAYINEWANLKFDMEGFTEENEYSYQTFTTATTECGLVVNSDKVNQLVIAFEDLRIYGGYYGEEEYMEALVSSFTSTVNSQGVVCTVGEQERITIGGSPYLAVRIILDDSVLNQYICVRVVEDRAVFIAVSAFDFADIERALDRIEPCV